MGFTNSTSDPCLFSVENEHGKCIVACYVDDIICAYSSDAMLKWFKSGFLHSDSNPDGLRGKHMGSLSWFLGVAVDQAGDYSTSANQEKYIEKMVDKFAPSHGVNGIKHSMPHDAATFSKLTGASNDIEREKMRTLPYM